MFRIWNFITKKIIMLEIHRYDLKTGIDKYKIFSDDIDDEDTKRTISNLNKYISDAYYYGVRVLC